jgi:hypothetical protein
VDQYPRASRNPPLQVPKRWLERVKTASKVVMVVEISAIGAEFLTAKTLQDQKKAADKALAMLGQELLEAPVEVIARWMATRAVMGLAAAFMVTPAGWVFVSAAFVLQTVASIYISDLIENEWQPFQTGLGLPELP